MQGGEFYKGDMKVACHRAASVVRGESVFVTEKLMFILAQSDNVLLQLSINNTIEHRVARGGQLDENRAFRMHGVQYHVGEVSVAGDQAPSAVRDESQYVKAKWAEE